MDRQIKNTLGVVTIITLLVISFGVFSYTRSYNQSASVSFPALSVNGEGEVVGVPDIAKFSLGVITEGGKDVGALQSDNTKKMNKIIDFLKEQGIDEKDIKTTSYNISPRRNFNSQPLGVFNRSGEIIGYSIEQNVEVTIRDFTKIGVLLSKATEVGANSVSNFYFSFADPIELENEARTLAFAEAEKKAKLIAKAGGFKLGRLLSIDQGGFYPMTRMAFGGAETAYDKAVPAPQIEPGSEQVKVNVTLRYEIRD